MTDKLLNYNLILGRGIVHELGTIFNFKNKTITLQVVPISIKPPNCMAKEFFAMKENHLVWNSTKTIKQILDAEYKKSNLKTINMSLNHLKVTFENYLLELF